MADRGGRVAASAAADTPGMVAKPAVLIRAAVPVVAVTLFEDRAHVVRRASVSVVRGTSRLRIAGVAPVIVDKSVCALVLDASEGRAREEGAPGNGTRASAKGVRVVDVRVHRTRATPEHGRSQGSRALDEAWRALEREKSTLADRRGLIELELEALDALAQTTVEEIAEDAAWARAQADKWQTQLDALDARERALRAEMRGILLAEREVAERMQWLGERRHRQTGRAGQGGGNGASTTGPGIALACELDVLLQADEDCEFELQLDYLVPGACWRPYHRIRLLPGQAGGHGGHGDHGDHGGGHDQGAVEVRSEGCIWQHTGEDWNDVVLSVSTQRSSLGHTPPLLSEDRLQTQRRTAETIAEVREVEIDAIDVREPREQAPSSPLPGVPGVDDGGETVTLRARHRATVPSDGAPYRFELFRFRGDCATELVVAPEIESAVILRTVQHNRAERPLLAGPVDLIRSAGLAGRTKLLYVAPGEPFELGWGPDPALRVYRRQERLEDESRVLSSWTTQRYKIVIRLSNLGDGDKQVRVQERVPVSEIEKVQITIDEAGTSDGASVDEHGIVSWRVDVAAYGHCEVVLRYDVRKHDDVRGLLP